MSESNFEKTVFSKIIDREIPGHFVYEDDVCIAILDIAPNTTGQTLVIPKTPAAYVFDLDDTTYQHLMMVAKKIAQALDTTFKTKRTCVVIEGFDVPHVHIKLYPIVAGNLSLAMGEKATDETLAVTADKIKASLAL